MPNFKLAGENSLLEQLQIEGIDNAYVIKNLALEEILFNRNVIGLRFTHACEVATKSFFLHFEPELRSISDDVAELMILTKGMYYWIHNAYEKAFGRNLEINYVSTNRVEVTKHGFPRVEVWSSIAMPRRN